MFKVYSIELNKIVDVYAIDCVNSYKGNTSRFLIYLDGDSCRIDDKWVWVPARDFIPEEIYNQRLEKEMVNETDLKPKMNPPQLEWGKSRYI